MAGAARKNGRSLFSKIFLGVLIAAVLLLIAAIIVVHFLLRDFEAAQPKYVAQQVFSDYFTGDGAAAAKLISLNQFPFDSEEQIGEYVKNALSQDNITYYEVSNGLEAGRRYTVKSGDKRLFTFTLDERSEKSSFGFVQYELGDIIVNGSCSVKVRIPDGYSLYLNGIQVGSEYITESGIVSDVFEYVPQGIKLPTENVYTVNGLLVAPEITADNGEGIPTSVSFDEEKGEYVAQWIYDDDLKEKFSTYVIEAAQAYAAYMQNDYGFRRVAEYLDPNSELYTLTRNTITGFVIDHDGFSFEDESAGEFTKYDDDTFSCRVKLTHRLRKAGNTDYVEYLDVMLFLHKVGEDYLIFDRFNMN